MTSFNAWAWSQAPECPQGLPLSTSVELDSVWMEPACSSQATGEELQAQDEGVLHKLTPHHFSLLMNQLSALEIHPDPKLRSIIELILEEAALLQNHRAAVRDYRPGLVPRIGAK